MRGLLSLRGPVLAALVLGCTTASVAAPHDKAVRRSTYEAKLRNMRARAENATAVYSELIAESAREFRVHPALIAAVITVESNGDPSASSRSGASGLMQLMPETCSDYGVWDPFDPEANIRGGTAMLANHLRRYAGNIDRVLAAYNAGARHADRGTWRRFPQTRRYVPKVRAYYQALRSGGLYAAMPRKNPASYAASEPTAALAPVSAPVSAKVEPEVALVPPPISYRIIGMMFESVRRSPLVAPGVEVVENGAMHEVANAVLSEHVTGRLGVDWVTDRVKQGLAGRGLSLSNVSTFVLRTPGENDLADALASLPAAIGNRVGLAHAESQGEHIWLIVFAR